MTVSSLTKADVDLRARVLQELEFTPQVDAHDIGVTVESGAVGLTGFVETYAEKLAAQQAVKGVVGVRAIANDIEVKGLGQRADPDIAKLAMDALASRFAVPSSVRAIVRNGYVILEGKATWMYQKAAAESAVSYLPGVLGVDNRIELTPNISPVDVKHRIESALARAASIDAQRIAVTADDGVVRLDGNVRSYLEKEEAERAAWAAPGVRRVVNHLQVALR